MDSLGTFVNIKKNDLFFGGCGTCEGNCCNGAKGFAVSPLILEDFEQVCENFAIVFSMSNKKLNAFVVLNDGKGHCKYYIDNKCSIYEKRTPACKLYPISPYFDNILIDTDCPSINNEFGDVICKDGKLNDAFYTKRLDNFNEKLQESVEFYESIKDMNHFKFIGHINGMPLLKYIKETDNKYIKMHLDSLKHYESKLNR